MRRANKYNARKVELDGYVFDSEMEARRYGQLKMLQLGKFIKNLMVHPVSSLTVNDIRICKYVADFVYTDVTTGKRIYEDVKGVRTREFIIKKKLMKAIHGIDVKEVRA